MRLALALILAVSPLAKAFIETFAPVKKSSLLRLFERVPGSFVPDLPNPFAAFGGGEYNKKEDGDQLISFDPSPEGLVAQTKRLLATDLLDPSLLDDARFEWISPSVDKPLDKTDYLAAGRFFDVRRAFPDLNYRAHDFRLDGDDTVRFTCRIVGTMRGELRLRDAVLAPTGKTMRCPPESYSITFDTTTGKVLKLCTGFCLDRLVGNTDGTTGVVAAAITGGQPVSDWEVYPPATVLQRFFGRPTKQIPDATNFLAPFPETVMIQLAKGMVASNLAADDPTLLADDFTYCTLTKGPIRRDEYLEKIAQEEFRDVQPNVANYRVDPYDPERVWIDLKPTGPGYQGAPQAMSFTFDQDGYCKRLTAGVVLDPTVGNGDGLPGPAGVRYAKGESLNVLETRPLPRILGRTKASFFSLVSGGSKDEAMVPPSPPAPPVAPPVSGEKKSPLEKISLGSKKVAPPLPPPVAPKPVTAAKATTRPSPPKPTHKKKESGPSRLKQLSSSLGGSFNLANGAVKPKPAAPPKPPAEKPVLKKDTPAPVRKKDAGPSPLEKLSSTLAGTFNLGSNAVDSRATVTPKPPAQKPPAPKKASRPKVKTPQAPKKKPPAPEKKAPSVSAKKKSSKSPTFSLPLGSINLAQFAPEKSPQKVAAERKKETEERKKAQEEKKKAAARRAEELATLKKQQAARRAAKEKELKEREAAAAARKAAQEETRQAAARLAQERARKAKEEAKLAQERQAAQEAKFAEEMQREAAAVAKQAAADREAAASRIAQDKEREAAAAANRAAEEREARRIAQEEERQRAAEEREARRVAQEKERLKAAERETRRIAEEKERQRELASKKKQPLKKAAPSSKRPTFSLGSLSLGGKASPKPPKKVSAKPPETKALDKRPTLPLGSINMAQFAPEKSPKQLAAERKKAAEDRKKAQAEKKKAAARRAEELATMKKQQEARRAAKEKELKEREAAVAARKAAQEEIRQASARMAKEREASARRIAQEQERQRELTVKMAAKKVQMERRQEERKEAVVMKQQVKQEKTTLSKLARAASSATIRLLGFGRSDSDDDEEGAPSPKASKVTKKSPRGVPTISRWRKNFDGSISGRVSGSRSFEEGEKITTSKIAKGTIASGQVVTTGSGSRYFLK